MDELTLDNKIYISSKKAAAITGYAKDYVGQLCREGRVAARLVGRSWYVLEESIKSHRFGQGETIENISIKIDEKIEEKNETIKDSIEKDTKYNTDFEHIYFPDDTEPILESSSLVEQEAYVHTEEVQNQEHMSDMQNVWKEWFEQKGKQNENHHNEYKKETEDVVEEITPYSLDSSEEVQNKENKEEQVPLHIVHQKEIRKVTEVDYMAPILEREILYVVPEHRSAHSLKVLKNNEKSRNQSFLGLKASLIGIILICVSITIIALGVFRPLEATNQPIYIYFSGETRI
jgi:hypothetical protein